MIDKIKIKNVQSHADTTICFCQGINAIVGSSNNGKSAVLRALYWARYNRPLGTDTLLSHWAFDKKGQQLGEMEVEVTCNGQTVRRVRTKTENKYVVGKTELEAVKSDVPEQVERALRLTETNIQRQQDAPFLLSLTNGQVAAYFNRVVRLDVIDKVLANAESMRRKCGAEIKAEQEHVEEGEKKLETFAFVDNCEQYFASYDKLCAKLEEARKKFGDVNKEIEERRKVAGDAEMLVAATDAKKVVAEYDKVCVALAQANARLAAIRGEIKEHNALQTQVFADFSQTKQFAEKVSSNANKLRELRLALREVEEEVREFNELKKSVGDWKNEAEEYRKTLPDVCPLCGGRMKGGCR